MIKTTLGIEGMKCGMCEAHTNEAINNAFDVKKVTSSHSKGETVIISEKPISHDEIKKVISETGYTLTEIKEEPYKKKGLFSFGK